MQLQINPNKKELKHHGSYEFPLNISYEVLSLYEKGTFLWHWHAEIELTLVLEGQMEYQVNHTTYLLKEGEGLFCNVNSLHTGRMHENKDCKYIAITFHPRLIYGFDSSLIKTKYIDQILNAEILSSIYLQKDCSWQGFLLSSMAKIYELSHKKTDAYEMEIQLLLSQMVLTIYLHSHFDVHLKTTNNQNNINRIKSILSFIHEHYMDKITLDDIASTINLCKSECCRFFKANMSESLFDYLLSYRIEKSLPLLMDSNYNITEIASMTGFVSPSYFSKVFKKQMNCTPNQYRKLHVR